MADIFHYYGNDLALSATGDLLVADESTTTQQRLLRRLLTNPAVDQGDGTRLPGDYLYHPDYGAGIPKYIGELAQPDVIQGHIMDQVALEATVAAAPAPVVTVSPITDGLTATIAYTEADSQTPQVLNFDVTS